VDKTYYPKGMGDAAHAEAKEGRGDEEEVGADRSSTGRGDYIQEDQDE
jgi:hypothetical protein